MADTAPENEAPTGASQTTENTNTTSDLVSDQTQDVAVTGETPAPTKDTAAEQEAFLENFNWHNYQEGIDVIDGSALCVCV